MPCGHKELYLAINFLPCFRLLYIFICGILYKILQGTNGHAFRRIPYMLYHYFFDRHRGASASLFPRAQPERQGSDPEICGNRHRRHTRQLRLGRILNPRACGSLCEYSVPDLFLQPGYVYAPDQRAYPEQRGSCFSVDFHFCRLRRYDRRSHFPVLPRLLSGATRFLGLGNFQKLYQSLRHDDRKPVSVCRRLCKNPRI